MNRSGEENLLHNWDGAFQFLGCFTGGSKLLVSVLLFSKRWKRMVVAGGTKARFCGIIASDFEWNFN